MFTPDGIRNGTWLVGIFSTTGLFNLTNLKDGFDQRVSQSILLDESIKEYVVYLIYNNMNRVQDLH